MKSHEFITEAGIDNRPDMQIPEAEPENPGRRGFLKGVGAAAVGAAGLGTAKPAMSEEDYGRIVYNMLWLYEICKGDNWSTQGPSRSFCGHVKQSVQKFASRNDVGPMGKSSGKMILNNWYKKVISDYQAYEQNPPENLNSTGNPKLDRMIAVGTIRRQYVVAAPEIIQAFDSLLEF